MSCTQLFNRVLPPMKANDTRLDRASHNLNRLLDEPSLKYGLSPLKIYILGIFRMEKQKKTVPCQWLDRNRCSIRRQRFPLAIRLTPDSRQSAMSNWRPHSPDTSRLLAKNRLLAKRSKAKVVNPLPRFPLHLLRAAASCNPHSTERCVKNQRSAPDLRRQR